MGERTDRASAVRARRKARRPPEPERHDEPSPWTGDELAERVARSAPRMRRLETARSVHWGALAAYAVLFPATMIVEVASPSDWATMELLLMLAILVAFVTRVSWTRSAFDVAQASTEATALPTQLGSVLWAYLAPFVSFVRPYRLLRQLSTLSTSDDLPPVIEERTVEGTYRTPPRRTVDERMPPVLEPPSILLWQVLYVANLLLRRMPGHWADLVTAAFLGLDFLVTRGLTRRFAARVEHLGRLADAERRRAEAEVA